MLCISLSAAVSPLLLEKKGGNKMASHGRTKETARNMAMTTVLSLLVLWLCTGLCVCEDEMSHLPPAQQSAADAWATDQSPDTGGSLPSQVDEDGEWGSKLTEEEVPGTVEPDQVESEAVNDQSEAPQEEEEEGGIGPTTEMPLVETEIAKVNSAPTPEPEEPTEQSPQEVGDFVVYYNGDDTVCLRACFAAVLKVDYTGEDEDGEMVNQTAEIRVPEKADVGGFCNRGPDEQSTLQLEWDEGMYDLKITFQKKNSTVKGDPNFWEARKIQFTFDTRDGYYFDNAVDAGVRTVRTSPGATFFATPQGNSRICDAEDDITMLSSTNTTERVTLKISQLQLQPYGMRNGTFGEGVDCGEDLLENPNSNVASVAVGATLACLILVVLIIYAVGRKMGAINDRSGYKSVE
ncbi:lysosome-associated membrane glycoprotein 1-like [Acanthaster planci]|uniref:Lysosome-associated membrane glycoprotein 1-like n=1 Tax=Acanthaster planci TaxID=133434 RepID=A0A8B7Z1F7_ACAPL|nr:lysosome-associated membrane glycoprotein 1-like [Acanthaster planci]